MGADYLSGELTAVKREGAPAGASLSEWANLDWKAGHDYIDTIVVDDPDERDLFLDSYELEGDFNVEFRKFLHALLTETEETTTASREVDFRVVGPLIVFESGGMSWGDAPTTALETWWRWSDESMPEAGKQVMAKVGFIPSLGHPDCPYEIVRKP